MDKTTKKIEQIIREIEHKDVSINANSNDKKTISQVVDILLNTKQDNASSQNNENVQNIDSNDLYNFDMNELSFWKEKNNQYYKVDYYRNIFSNKRFLSKPIVFIKKLIRKTLKFLEEPIVLDQNEFNSSVTSSINALYNNAIVTQEFINNQITINKSTMLKDEIDKINEQLQELNTIKEQLQDFEVLKEQLQELETVKGQLKDLEVVKEQLQELETVKEQLQELEVIKEQLQELETMKEQLVEFDILKDQLQESKLQIDELCNEQLKLQELNVSNEQIRASQEQMQDGIVNQEINNIKWNIDRIENELKTNVKNESNSLEHRIDNVELNFLRAIKKYENGNSINKEVNPDKGNNTNVLSKEEVSDTYLAVDYFAFENYFRGTRKDIKKSQEMYIDYFTNKGEIIDIGCGRGEFLELMQEKGIHATGVDAYDEFVEYCNMKGFDTVKDDAISYVSKLDNDSIGGLFASQLAEHLETNQLIQLCKDAYKKLLPGSCFILETPNPTSLAIYMNGFYLDPSHNKPVHPKTLEYFLKMAGFKNIKVVFTEQSKVDYRLPLLNGDHISNLSEFNDGINCISDIIFGSQDYAIIAQK